MFSTSDSSLETPYQSTFFRKTTTAEPKTKVKSTTTEERTVFELDFFSFSKEDIISDYVELTQTITVKASQEGALGVRSKTTSLRFGMSVEPNAITLKFEEGTVFITVKTSQFVKKTNKTRLKIS